MRWYCFNIYYRVFTITKQNILCLSKWKRCGGVSVWLPVEKKVKQLNCIFDWKTAYLHSPLKSVVCHSVKRSTQPINIHRVSTVPLCDHDRLFRKCMNSWSSLSGSLEDTTLKSRTCIKSNAWRILRDVLRKLLQFCMVSMEFY